MTNRVNARNVSQPRNNIAKKGAKIAAYETGTAAAKAATAGATAAKAATAGATAAKAATAGATAAKGLKTAADLLKIFGIIL